MAHSAIVQNSSSRLGQSQSGRLPPELAAHFVDVDERRPADQLRFLTRLAATLEYYRDDIEGTAGNWSGFFPALPEDPRAAAVAATKLLGEDAGTTPAHLALLYAFLELSEQPRDALNRFTQRHLEFYYRRVLRFEHRPPVADRAHVLVELKKQSPAQEIGPEHVFTAGKDAKGVELLYAPINETTVVAGAAVESLSSVFVDRRGRGTVRFAPIANSADGLGGALTGDEAEWSGFGHAALQPGEVGFAIAAPVLRMKEGARTVTLALTLGGLESAPGAAALAVAFEAFVTGAKGWLGPYALTDVPAGADVVRLQFQVPPGDQAVVDYDRALHGYSYAARAPVAQLLLKPDALVGYYDVRRLTVRRVRVSVSVAQVSSLTLENDFGALEPKKKVLPFGPEPVLGAHFMIGCEEALSKKLSALEITLPWQDAPASFANRYADYGMSVNDGSFAALLSFRDGGHWELAGTRVKLFEPRSEAGVRVVALTIGAPSAGAQASESDRLYALGTAGTAWAARAATRWGRRRPIMGNTARVAPEVRPGFITFALTRDFLHATYRSKTIENALKFGRLGGTLVVLPEPYTPALRGVTLSYTAHSDDVDIASTRIEDFANVDIQFFHVGCLGQRREHGHQREQFAYLTQRDVPLVPEYDHAGELLIGLRGVKAGDGVSLLFQVSAGSEDADLPLQEVAWFALCDNYWKPLGPAAVARDTTNQLLTSGIVRFVIPSDATTDNTLLSAGLIWLKAAVADHPEAVCQLVTVAANAVEVQFRDAGNDPRRLATPLEQGRIAKLKPALPAVKSVSQPFASFGGCAAESDDALNTRAAERLRHRDRAVTAWDYERAVLEAFPAVHTVKCVPHARDGSWLAPGHVLLVLVPDLRQRGARDRLRPKVDADTISQIEAHVRRRCGISVDVRATNPRYQTVQLDFAVRFARGCDFNYYHAQLNRDLIRFLSPWAYDAGRPLSFGGRVFKSVLLDFVEEREYVDYVTDFKMYTYAGALDDRDRTEARPDTPDAILVSAATHRVREAAPE